MRSFVVLTFSLFVTLGSVFAQNDGSIAKGIKLVEELQYNSAVRYFNQLPQSVEKEFQLGKTYLYLSQKDSAQVHFAKAAQLDPKSIYSPMALGAIEVQNKNGEAASNQFNKARKQAKKNVEFLGEIAELCIIGAEKDFNLALSFIDKGKEINTKSAALSIALGDVELARSEYGNALSAYEWAVSYDNKNAITYRKMGAIQTLARDYRNGLESFKKSIELDSTQIIVYKNLSDLQFMYGKYAESLINYETFLRKATPNIEDKERYALILFFNKKYAESAKEMDIVLAENPNTPVLYRIRGYSAYETGITEKVKEEALIKFQKGVDAMKRFFEIQNPNKIIQSDYAYYGRLNSKVKNDSLAIIYLKKAISADSSKNEMFDELAQVYSRSHMHTEAVKCYNQMMVNGLPRVSGLYTIGLEYLYLGGYMKTVGDSLTKKGTLTTQLEQSKAAFQAADTTFSELNKLKPDYLRGYMLRAQALVYLDPESSLGLAKPVYEQVVALMESDPVKNKKNLTESYRYLAAYNLLSYSRDYKADPKSAAISRSNAISFYEKLLLLDPNDALAKQGLIDLKAKK